MDALNFILTVSICLIYVWRTYNMCLFDKHPIWRDVDVEVPLVNEISGKIIHAEECKGELEGIYYISLIIIHIYLLLEYVLRTLMEKYQLKFLQTFESMIEIFTTVPFLFFFFAFGRDSYIVQLFVMIDQFRLLLFPRYTKAIKNEL